MFGCGRTRHSEWRAAPFASRRENGPLASCPRLGNPTPRGTVHGDKASCQPCTRARSFSGRARAATFEADRPMFRSRSGFRPQKHRSETVGAQSRRGLHARSYPVSGAKRRSFGRRPRRHTQKGGTQRETVSKDRGSILTLLGQVCCYFFHRYRAGPVSLLAPFTLVTCVASKLRLAAARRFFVMPTLAAMRRNTSNTRASWFALMSAATSLASRKRQRRVERLPGFLLRCHYPWRGLP
jgi:hypothetical protein